ncbi:putative geranylgeranyltransferase type I beta subunit [Blumeria hordei DH14]|uniref:Putative geranylgeranyltransferase type I beta subunit n=1 Tax=Blumeria graminis f. sp. hordei (strain DH14) TaxID=546991 RepID=N1JBI0_BLUG1|nr:putative geranylgeranyltransferase type I beta subunit [Blumeria hordei DH14]
MEDYVLNRQLHINYWKRCLKSLLPTQYMSTDSSRMTLGFFILSALDLLGATCHQFLPEEEILEISNWIINCQHPHGGFCGSPNHRFPDEYYVDDEGALQDIDPANLPATFFAILSLGFVGDLTRVARKKCLRWLKSLQRDDGSFGELRTCDGIIGGGRDMRYCYVAAAIRWMLKGYELAKGEDIDVEMLLRHIHSGQTYDGGISESSKHEAHAALSLLNRLPNPAETPDYTTQILTNIPETIRWLVSRQIEYREDEEEHDMEGNTEQGRQDINSTLNDISSDFHGGCFIGFNGRCNKLVDTCYAFWVIASLDLIFRGQENLVDKLAARRFLLKQTQHQIGGFSKMPGDPPGMNLLISYLLLKKVDIYHSYLGLAALALMREPGLKALDPALCVSLDHRSRILQLRDAALVPTHIYWKHGYCFLIREDDSEFESETACKI